MAVATASAELNPERGGKGGNNGEISKDGGVGEKGETRGCEGGVEVGSYNLGGFAAEEKTLALLKPGVSELHSGTRHEGTNRNIFDLEEPRVDFPLQNRG